MAYNAATMYASPTAEVWSDVRSNDVKNRRIPVEHALIGVLEDYLDSDRPSRRRRGGRE
jgi:hypothetical protein